jgi:hypothetical protein
MKKCKNKSNVSIIRDYLEGISPCPTFGYIPPTIKRGVGDEWEKNGITWRQENGYITRVNKKSNVIKKAIGIQKCNCGLEIRFGNRFDKLFFAKTGMCQDCLAMYETRLRAAGLFPLYEKYKLLSNESGFLKDAKSKLKEVIKYFETEDTTIEILCNSDGFRERFHGTNKEQILKDARNDLKIVRRRLTEVNKLKDSTKKELMENADKVKVKIYA